MTIGEISIEEYKASDASTLLELLLKLHADYFHSIASAELIEMKEELDIQKSFEAYINTFANEGDNNWKTYLARTPYKKTIGFIIGSIKEDDAQIRSITGIIEDWFVEEEFRGKEIGMKLYFALEDWFKHKGCHQVISDTWEGNAVSIEAHRRMGFFISGIKFSKKLK